MRWEDPRGRLVPNPFAGNILCMPAVLSSSALVGLDAVTTDVVVDSDRLKLVEPKTGRCVLSVRQPEPVVGTPSEGSGVQVPLRKRGPEESSPEKSPQMPHLDQTKGDRTMMNCQSLTSDTRWR